MRIHAGLVDHKPRASFAYKVQGFSQVLVCFLFIPWRHSADDGSIALEGGHASAADGEVEEIRHGFRELGRSVASVLVAVEDEDFERGIQCSDEGESVEGAEATTALRVGVVESLRDICCNAVLKRQPGGKEVAPVDCEDAVSVALAPPAESASTERTVARKDVADIGWVVDPQEVGFGGRRGFEEFGKARCGRAGGHKREFAHRGGAGVVKVGRAESGADGDGLFHSPSFAVSRQKKNHSSQAS